MSGCTIRKYKVGDKENLRYICRETAGDYFKKNGKLLKAVSIIYSDYFTENEPENIFVVADESDRAVGYIICTDDFDRFKTQMKKKYIPAAVRAHVGMLPVCIGYMTAVRMNGRENGTHLHIDILPDYQHMGLGTQLINELRNHLSDNGTEYLAVNSIDRNASAYKFYIKYGFRENKHFIGKLVSLKIPTEIRTEAVK